MTDGPNARLVREMFSAANRAAETGSLDDYDWLNLFSPDILWEAAEDAPDAGTTEGMKAFVATSRTGSTWSTDSDRTRAG
jgi:ketosteroid isomerase-like protein